MGCIEEKIEILSLPRWFLILSWTTRAEREDEDNSRNKNEATQKLSVERTGNWEFWQKHHSGLYTEQRQTAGKGVTFRVKTMFSG